MHDFWSKIVQNGEGALTTSCEQIRIAMLKRHKNVQKNVQKIKILHIFAKNRITMDTLSVTDFRSQLATYFDRVLAGEKVFIRRKNKLFTIIPVDEGDLTISPELAEKIAKARKEHHEEKTMKFSSAAAAQKWMDEL